MSTGLALFAVAKEALAEARRVDEVKSVRDEAVRMRLYGEQARDRTIIADASEIIARAERKLGELIRSAKEVGQLGIGRPARSNVEGNETDDENGTPPVPFSRVTLEEAGISKKLSAKSQKLASLDETAFEAAMQSARDKIISGDAVMVNPLKDMTTAAKKAKRVQREAELGARQMALPEAKFGVILADPEWQFEVRSEAGLDRAADNHYPTSPLAAIKDRDVGSLAADDCVLLLWATVPMLVAALDVLAAWGFSYKSHLIWNKDRIGTGYWSRNKHELLLIGTRGNIPAPAMGEQCASVIDAAVGAHSAKPEKFYEIIEAYFPTLPKIELNARQARPGWVRWGYEAPPAVASGQSEKEAGLGQSEEEAGPGQAGGETSGQVAERAPVEPCSDAHGDENGLRLKGDATLALPGVGSRESGSLAVDATDAPALGDGTTQCEDGASPALPNPPPTAAEALQTLELREAYEGEIALLGARLGRLSMAEAAAALRAGRAAGVSPLLIAADIGHPLGTVKAWLNRLGLTSMAHLAQLNAEFGAASAAAAAAGRRAS